VKEIQLRTCQQCGSRFEDLSDEYRKAPWNTARPEPERFCSWGCVQEADAQEQEAAGLEEA
jgi:hypothetical protein